MKHKMKKIYIYGTGSKALKFLPALALKYQIAGFLDSDIKRQGQYLLGIEILHLSSIKNVHYDHIVIASSYTDEINQNLLDYNFKNGIPVEQLQDVLQLNKQYTQLENRYQALNNTYIPRYPCIAVASRTSKAYH